MSTGKWTGRRATVLIVIHYRCEKPLKRKWNNRHVWGCFRRWYLGGVRRPGICSVAIHLRQLMLPKPCHQSPCRTGFFLAIWPWIFLKDPAAATRRLTTGIWRYGRCCFSYPSVCQRLTANGEAWKVVLSIAAIIVTYLRLRRVISLSSLSFSAFLLKKIGFRHFLGCR